MELLSAGGLKAEQLPPGADGIDIFRIAAADAPAVLRTLADDPSVRFDLLLSITGTDFRDRFEILYHIYSTSSDRNVCLKAGLDHADPRIPSVCGIHPCANYYERETWDLLGVRFEGHPDLRRLLLPYTWKGHPLRKDYVMDDVRLTWNSR